jgi:tetratricopeptide (TPR) repeat protein
MYLPRRAAVYLALRRYGEAHDDAVRAISLSRESAGKEVLSSWNGRAYLAMARALEAQGKLAEARAAYASAVENLRPSLGQEHPETREAAQGAGIR